jgi:hypothetical protein
MKEYETIGFCYEERYCVKCDHKEGYNGCKPLEAPIKCSHCGGRMTDKYTEKWIKELEEDINSINKQIKFIKENKCIKHLLNHSGDSSTECGKGIEELYKNESSTIIPKYVSCKKCLNSYNYWKIQNVLNKYR